MEAGPTGDAHFTFMLLMFVLQFSHVIHKLLSSYINVANKIKPVLFLCVCLFSGIFTPLTLDIRISLLKLYIYNDIKPRCLKIIEFLRKKNTFIRI